MTNDTSVFIRAFMVQVGALINDCPKDIGFHSNNGLY